MKHPAPRFHVKKWLSAMLLAATCLTLTAGQGVAQGLGEPGLETVPASVQPDQTVELHIVIPLTEELHLYGPKAEKPYFATKAAILEGGPIDWKADPRYPPTTTIDVFGNKIEVLEPAKASGAVSIRFAGQVHKDVKPGEYPIRVELTYQACSASSCHPPIQGKRISTMIRVESRASAASQPGKTEKRPSERLATAPASVQPGSPGGGETAKPTGPETVMKVTDTVRADKKPIFETETRTGKGMATITESGEVPITKPEGQSDKAYAIPADSVCEPAETPEEGLGTTISLFDFELDLRKAGLWIPLLVAFLAGVILNIMPCVLPVIPIKILQLTKQAEQEHHSPLRQSLAFAAGVITFFLSIAVLALVLKGGFTWGQVFQSSAALTVLSLIMVLLALGMFDVYQVMVPKFIANRSFVQKGFAGAYSMGFLAGILSTPCSFGILGAAVAWAQSQAAWITVLAFMTIGVGMAFPYVLLSAFPRFIKKIPKAGRWSELFKQSMGFLLLAVAVFLITALPKDKVLWTMLYMILFAFVVWFWGVVLEFRTAVWSKLARFGGLTVLILAGWGMLRTEPEPLKWQMLTPETYQMALGQGKDVVVEFTADWCINCRTVEYLVFDDSEMKGFLKNNDVILLRGDLTEGDPYVKRLLKEWTGTDAPPYTVVFKQDNRKVLLPGIYSTDDLMQAIRQTLDSSRSTWNEG